ncbi:MAG TPA: potassium-transporting ATPase subunit KdpC [Candidatus Omnitrophota bacterium]|nr:potassium-transporting ATPase subunit KdpC [Candidatus Omnitrophota bacterium]
MKDLITGIKLFLAMAGLTGLIYPLLMTGIGQAVFNDRSNGSIYKMDGREIGSLLIGQKFDQDKYFWPRPSAIDYNPLPSGGSNLSVTSKKLAAIVEERKQKLLNADPSIAGKTVPSDLLYASGSGLDPHLTPAAALFQVDRVARARGYDSAKKSEIIGLIVKLTEGRDLGLFGEKRVNVLELNAELDRLR